MKDYVKGHKKPRKLRSTKNPSGRNRKNKLRRDFYSDVSKRKDQVENINEDQDTGPFDPHEYL